MNGNRYVDILAKTAIEYDRRRKQQRALRTHVQQQITDGWADLAREYPTTHVITLAYNNNINGKSSSSCNRYDGDGILLSTTHNSRSNTMYDVRKVLYQQIHEDLDGIHLYVDRKCCGSKYNHLSEIERSGFVGFVEHPDANTHVHLAWREPPCAPGGEATAKIIRSIIDQRWMAKSKMYSFRVNVFEDSNWPDYITKNRWQIAFGDQPELFVSSRKIPN